MSELETINPFASPQTESVDDPLAVELKDLPTRARRLFAALLDLLIVQTAVHLAGGFLITFINLFQAGMDNMTYEPPVRGLGEEFTKIYFVMVTCGLFFYLFFDGYLLKTRGQTIGKALFRMKIVRRNGEPTSLLRLVGLRYVPLLLYCSLTIFAPLTESLGLQLFALLFAASILIDPLLIFTPEKRCLHDYIAGTIVVKAGE